MHLELSKGSRSKVLAIIIFIIMAVFIGRLFYLQIIQHGHYQAVADAQQTQRLAIPATRGEIYAMDGDSETPLVLNQTVYTVFADPATVSNAKAIVSLVNKVAGSNAMPNLAKLLANKESRYEVLAQDVTPDQAATLKAAGLDGLGFQQGTERVYPEGSLAAQTLGFVNEAGVGQYGIEGGLNSELTGKDGELKSVTDVNDVPLTIGNDNVDTPAQNGKNVVLTIDRNIQAYTEQALAASLKQTGATNGSVIVMNPQNGKVMAMANLPTYNPAKYQTVTNAADFNNAVVSAPYEPGSDIKTLTAAIGIDKGVITPQTTYDNTDAINVDGTIIHNASTESEGIITIQDAMDYSLNTGFVTVAEKLGDGQNITLNARNIMYNYYYNHFGLGQMTGIQVAGEVPGTIIPPTDVQGNAVRYSNMSFGQGMDLTMLQVASAFSSVINGGTYYYPTVVNGTMSDDGTTFTPAASIKPRTGVIKKSTSATVLQMVHEARDRFYAKDDKPGFFIGGKTGTSQAIVNGTYSNTQTIGTYLGYGAGGDEIPKYVIMVQVSGAGQNLAGNTDAMPIFNNISNWLTSYLQLKPNAS